MDNEKRKHNTPIATVIKNYLDKDGGKVIVSRNEIDRRFYALDWRYQKQILFAFLQSGKTDRDWAYRKLNVVWDDCFISVGLVTMKVNTDASMPVRQKDLSRSNKAVKRLIKTFDLEEELPY